MPSRAGRQAPFSANALPEHCHRCRPRRRTGITAGIHSVCLACARVCKLEGNGRSAGWEVNARTPASTNRRRNHPFAEQSSLPTNKRTSKSQVAVGV